MTMTINFKRCCVCMFAWLHECMSYLVMILASVFAAIFYKRQTTNKQGGVFHPPVSYNYILCSFISFTSSELMSIVIINPFEPLNSNGLLPAR